MNINILLGVIIEFLKSNCESLQNTKIAKDTKPYIITLEYSYRDDLFDLMPFSKEIKENIIAYIEGKSELQIETISAIKDIKMLSDIIYRRNTLTFPKNDAHKVIQLLDLAAGLLGYNKALMVKFTFPRNKVFEMKISKKKGMLTKNEILQIVANLIDFFRRIKKSLIARRYVYAEADGIIKYYYVEHLPFDCCEFYRSYIDKFMSSHQSSFIFTTQGKNQNYEEIYCLQVNGAETIRNLFGMETPLLVYDYNLYVSFNICFKEFSGCRLLDNYLQIYDLSNDDPYHLICFLLAKVNLPSGQLIQKWKIKANETYLYSSVSAMILTLLQDLKKEDLSSFYKAEINNLYRKLKPLLERYVHERNQQITINNFKNTHTQNIGVVIQDAAEDEEELPELVHLDQVGEPQKKFNTIQDELTAAFKNPLIPQALLLPRIRPEKTSHVYATDGIGKIEGATHDQFTLLTGLKHCVQQTVDKSVDSQNQLKQINQGAFSAITSAAQQIEQVNNPFAPTSQP